MKALIETQFPVSKVSKESYKERKAGASQTLTGLGKWWGRKPLILCRAAILGCLLPATDNPAKDGEIFLKLLAMDEEGLWLRKDKKFSAAELVRLLRSRPSLWEKYRDCFEEETGKLRRGLDAATREEMEKAAFKLLGYDAKIAMCRRPEHLENLSEEVWRAVNLHLGTSAHSLQELVRELSMRRFGHPLRVGDCFCGGGSIPFEAARVGAEAYGSDLNPVAGLLTWASLHLCSASEEELVRVRAFLEKVYRAVDDEIRDLGVESRDNGDRAISYIYCVEAKCPECGTVVPLAPSWVIGNGTKTVAIWTENGRGGFDVAVKMGAGADEFAAAAKGTVTDRGMVCPHCGAVTPITVLRGDRTGANGETTYGLRRWEKGEWEARPDDVFHERLYCVKYEHAETRPDGKVVTTRYYQAPDTRDLANEAKVHDIVAENFATWQRDGLVPSMAIESGFNTDQLIRERGWTYWHQLFNARTLLMHSITVETIDHIALSTLEVATGLLCLHKCLDNNSNLCRMRNDETHPNSNVFYNQALNTLMNFAIRGWGPMRDPFILQIPSAHVDDAGTVALCDARVVDAECDFWITDPPYADAVNYHELSEFFLAWDKTLLKKAFPEWYADSKRALAVRGDEHFSATMIDIYRRLSERMPEDGMQVVLFTHSDPAVWAQLALIMWRGGLAVTAAWNVATETDMAGLKGGNYVKGTVLLVLRRLTGDASAFLDELESDIRREVRAQIESMQTLDRGEEPNFSDPDYILAAYAASLKVLTANREIGDITDFDHELRLAIEDPEKSEVVKLIERARSFAYDCLIPASFDAALWRGLSPAERFYVKGLESEKRGLRQLSTHQEYARGFGLGDGYGKLLASARANEARLRTAGELGLRAVPDLPGFEEGLLRLALGGVAVATKNEDAPEKALAYVRGELGERYWEVKPAISVLVGYLASLGDFDAMDHWRADARAAGFLLARLEADRV